MKSKFRISLTAVTLISLASPVLAATEGRVANSNLLAWGFLAMCALIVVCQVFPIVSTLISLVKNCGRKDVELSASRDAS